MHSALKKHFKNNGGKEKKEKANLAQARMENKTKDRNHVFVNREDSVLILSNAGKRKGNDGHILAHSFTDYI